jgi:hypothetical protein
MHSFLEKLRFTQMFSKFPTFYKTEGSLSCSQQSTTGPYRESAEFSPYPAIPLLEVPFSYYPLSRSSEWSLTFTLSNQKFGFYTYLFLHCAQVYIMYTAYDATYKIVL